MPDGGATVVIPAYRAWSTLPLVLDALAPQVAGTSCEVVVVDSSGGDVHARLERWPWVRVVAPAERTLPGPARNLGAAQATGEWIAFLDADAIPAPGWLRALLAAATAAVDAVGGTVRNGTPTDPIGTAGWLLEFSEFLPERQIPLRHAASCNLLVRRTTFEEAGGFPVDVWPGEDTIFTLPLADTGRLAFAPDAAVHHLNRTGFAEFLRHQRRLGMSFGVVCDRVPFPYRSFARPPLWWAAGVLRLAALARRLADNPRRAAAAVLLSPLLVLGLGAWTLGLVTRR